MDKKKAVVIIGHGTHHAQIDALRLSLQNQGFEIKTVEEAKILMAETHKQLPKVQVIEHDLEVNGIKYALRKEEQPYRGANLAGYAAALIAMSSMYGARTSKAPKTPEVNIISEFKLIQEKKSNLPRSERDAVVKKFNSIFRVIEPNK